MTEISESRTRELLQWLDDQAGDHTHLFEQMARYRDAAALIRQLQAAEQAAWRAGLDAGREQGKGKDHAHPATTHSEDRYASGLELLEALKMARAELAGLPRSLGYGFTHLPKIDAVIAKHCGHERTA